MSGGARRSTAKIGSSDPVPGRRRERSTAIQSALPRKGLLPRFIPRIDRVA